MCFGVLHIYLLQYSNLMHLLTTFGFRETDLEIDCVRRSSKNFDNDPLLYFDTIQACELQHVYVWEFGFVGELALVIIESREHYIRRNGGELSWEFLDELSSVVQYRNFDFSEIASLFIQ